MIIKVLFMIEKTERKQSSLFTCSAFCGYQQNRTVAQWSQVIVKIESMKQKRV